LGDGRRTLTHDKSSPGLWPDELTKNKQNFNQNEKKKKNYTKKKTDKNPPSYLRVFLEV
jgi:hypothetical protein